MTHTGVMHFNGAQLSRKIVMQMQGHMHDMTNDILIMHNYGAILNSDFAHVGAMLPLRHNRAMLKR